jgi:uncharacterized protein YheU (UPF0270 family)
MPGRCIVIPYEQLSPEALTGVIEAYVNREGTDYGLPAPLPLAQKVEHVRRQLLDGQAAIVYDPKDQSCNIIPRESLPRAAGD